MTATPPARVPLTAPLDGRSMECPVVEAVATTRREEARTAMAIVAALLDRGVAVRDVAVVARGLDHYEDPLHHAARQCGVIPAFWTQLQVTHTRPFALVESVCAALDAETPSREVLWRPLELRWCPPSVGMDHTADGGTEPPRSRTGSATVATSAATDSTPDSPGNAHSWPIHPATVQSSKQALPADARPLDAWCDAVDARPGVDDRVLAYLDWLRACRSLDEPSAATGDLPPRRSETPSPDTVAAVLTAVIDAYDAVGLSVTMANDSPDRLETQRETRAIERLQTLIGQLRHKYADRLADGTIDRSWNSVAELSRVIATELPGRRELGNATAVDIFEANDMWLLNIPYVIAVGLVDGEWPRQARSTIPAALQAAILQGDGDVGTLAPWTAWSSGRDRDQFADTVRAASAGLIVTRHSQTLDGDTRRPSPFLDELDTDRLSEAARRDLVGATPTLPGVLAAMLDAEVTDAE
ncbi:MAG: hypothetical protein ACOCQY_03765 [Halorhabdus sp.]